MDSDEVRDCIAECQAAICRAVECGWTETTINVTGCMRETVCDVLRILRARRCQVRVTVRSEHVHPYTCDITPPQRMLCIRLPSLVASA